MFNNNYYDVTKWEKGNPYEDIGAVINSILEDVKARQKQTDVHDGGKPGAVIYIPSGDYHLKSQVVIDVSYLKIEGSGHGFVSSSIRYNLPKESWPELHNIWPGGSRIINDLLPDPEDPRKGAAFCVDRAGDPRISSVEFKNFCIDGLHFVDDGSGDPENTYLNGKTGIYVACPHDSFRISEMGLVYLEHGLVCCCADALSIHDNFIAECGNCIELRTWGQASKITDNLIGAGYRGYSIYAENFGGLLISGNNVFPRGRSSIEFSRVMRSSVTGNRLHSFYPGMLIMDHNCCENLVASNHFLRDHEPWPPMQGYDNELDDTFGLIRVNGKNNTIVSNHISETIARKYLKPCGVTPVIIHIVSGDGNFVNGNHIVATTEPEDAAAALAEDTSCYGAQVAALLAIDKLVPLEVTEIKM